MATTTNYSWSTPDDTALVKDGAAAIRTLGSSADTTVKALNPGTTAGDIDYYTTSTAKARVAIGTAGQVLQVNSGATAPEWATFTSGGMTLISETVASGLSSLSLSGISGSYKQLLLIWSGIYHSAAGNFFAIRFNNDSTSSIYQGNASALAGTTELRAGSFSDDKIKTSTASRQSYPFGGEADFSTTDINAMANGQMLIDNYASTSKYKSFNTNYGCYDNANSIFVTSTIVGAYKSTSALTSIDIVRIAGAGTFSNTTNTSIRLYGVS
jgi:hypothetical protein